MQLWDIKHITGIPHSPTGQAIVERANGTLKRYLEKFKDTPDIRERLDRTLFVLNYLCIFGDDKEPPVIRHHIEEEMAGSRTFRVKYRDIKTGIWIGPADVIYVGRGYVYIFPHRPGLDSQPVREANRRRKEGDDE